jgi:hypothetical protein
VVAFAGHARAVAAQNDRPQLPPPSPEEAHWYKPQTQTSINGQPLDILGACIAAGRPPSPQVIAGALAQAAAIGRPDIENFIVGRFIKPTVDRARAEQVGADGDHWYSAPTSAENADADATQDATDLSASPSDDRGSSGGDDDGGDDSGDDGSADGVYADAAWQAAREGQFADDEEGGDDGGDAGPPPDFGGGGGGGGGFDPAIPWTPASATPPPPLPPGNRPTAQALGISAAPAVDGMFVPPLPADPNAPLPGSVQMTYVGPPMMAPAATSARAIQIAPIRASVRAPGAPPMRAPAPSHPMAPRPMAPRIPRAMVAPRGAPRSGSRSGTRSAGNLIGAPPEIEGVAPPAWSAFLGKLAREAPSFKTDRHLGKFRQRRDRLAELGLTEGELADEYGQEKAIAKDLADAYRHARAGALVTHVGQTIDVDGQPVAITLSGLLGTISAAGLEGAASWLEDESDRKRFPGTTGVFLRTNGVF